MTNATDVIAHLLPRKAAPIVERQTGLPFGWGLWLRALPERLGRITREKADAILDLLASHTPKARRAAPFLPSRFYALRSLFYQGWGPPPREERWMRWAAAFTSSTLHLLFFLFLLWVALVQIPPPPEEAGDSSRVRLEMIGEGSPEAIGGATEAGEAVAEQPASAAAASPPSAAPSPSPPQPAASSPPSSDAAAPHVAVDVPPVPARDVPVPEIADQPLQVTEVAEPTRAFVRPPPTPRQPEITQPAIREVGVPTRDIPTPITAPVVRRDVPTRSVDVPTIATRDAEVQEREMTAPAPQVRAVPVPSREVTPRAIAAQERSVRQSEVREPSPRPAPAPVPAAQAPSNAGTSVATTPSRSTAPSTSSSATSPRGTTSPASRTPGPAAATNPGGWNTPARTDDWGNSRRNAAGDSAADGRDQAGLYNADGSLRVPGNAGDNAAADRGAPGGGNDQWTRERLEEAGTWLQRPPYDYEPTSFDKYWVPSESLLAEWVRRNVREVDIPIPGTNMKLKCSISVLQLGGGCGLGSLFPEPPKARPPPEIPVKRTPIPTDS
ncbi:hypothetical protein [Pseudoxanthomonas sp. PXM01]|uniref:hypothetical protein n=1 Tax=Pseudoxanthomonas sp. PXM01 TaxID=2769295 RepID=UPI0017853C03|nr:hypothetical protein [Pseudoxanthomonas sp. PXM01]MBD9467646.1 hypothetical protein [Pseudoxanthomonas sp. PXM01]